MPVRRNRTTFRAGSTQRGGAPVVAALDVGTAKTVCLIARLDTTIDQSRPQPEIIGIGHQVSRGMRAGAVVDLDLAEASIRAAVEAAESMANVRLQRVLTSVTCGGPHSRSLHVELDLNGNAVSEQDMRRVVTHARRSFDTADEEVLHALPVGFALDGCRGIKDPRDMYGDRLGVDINIVSAQAGPLRNLSVTIERSHLDLAASVLAPYASGLSVLVEDERSLGVTLVDMGAGTTSIAVFAEGELQFTHVLPFGGQHVTNDVARGLSTSVEQAERLKTLFGSTLIGARDEKEMVEITPMGDAGRGNVPVPKALLNKIIRARLEETFEHIGECLARSGYEPASGRQVVLTGGASQLTGAREIASQVLGRQVRLGAPPPLAGGGEAVTSPAFAASAGLLAYACRYADDPHLAELTRAASGERPSWLSKWFGEYF